VIAAVGLDLGTTRIKAGRLDAAGALVAVRSVPAPALRERGSRVEGDPRAYAAAADALLGAVAGGVPAGTPLGVASQRSTFVVWNAATLEPRSPMISWQDRRAAGRAAALAGELEAIVAATGLRPTAHAAGLKLAELAASDPGLGRDLRRGRARFGTLESFLLARWSRGRAHATDGTMAARTLLFDLAAADWCDPLLERLGLARACLPAVEPSAGRSEAAAFGLRLGASLADQAAALLAATGGREDTLLIQAGTGVFVLRPCGGAPRHVAGYLCGPALHHGRGSVFVLEGAVHAVPAALARTGAGPAPLPERDPSPDAFAVPDAAGMGSPYWLPLAGPMRSAPASGLDPAGRRRVVVEGLAFRVREIVDDLESRGRAARVVLSGGLAAGSEIATAVAAVLERTIHWSDGPEPGLAAAARLAAGRPPFVATAGVAVAPTAAGAYLPAKYPRFRQWLHETSRPGTPGAL
jgi:glycerol kinase